MSNIKTIIQSAKSGLDAFDFLKDLLIESLEIERVSTAHLYEYDDKRTPKQRKAANAAAELILAKVKSENYQVTDADKAVLAKYSGQGGALTGADGMKGSQYEYYTPTPIAEGMWALLSELGFNGGKVLDPCGGTGIFGATSPSNSVIDAVELSETSGMVQKLVNDNEFYSTTVAPFEKVAAANPDEIYDAVITNVPFGEASARGDNFMHDPKYQKETLQGYFILRSLEKLKPRGLAAFIVPPSVVTGLDAKSVSVRQKASLMAEFLGAYRLPNEVFGTAAADTMTDVIVFRKFSKEAAEKIAEVREQSPQTLIDAKVQWETFLDGHWYKGANERFILGDFIAKDPNAHHLSPEGRDRVTNSATMPDLAKMLKKFPASRIDWALLNTTEADPIVYKNGDTIVQSGQTLRYKNGTWEALPHNEDSHFATQTMSKCDTPYAAFESKVAWQDVMSVAEFMRNTSRGLDIPAWLRGVTSQIKANLDDGEQEKYWQATVVAMSMQQAIEKHVSTRGFNYLEQYPALSTEIQVIAKLASNPKSSLGSSVKDALKSVRNQYSLKTGFSKYWQGEVASLELKATDADKSFEGMMYKAKSKWISKGNALTALGADFNEFESTDYCVSGDGKYIIKTDDYFVGNLADFLTKLDADIEKAQGNDALIGKLSWQRAEALKRVDTIDVTQMNFNLFSPYVTAEEKLEFVKQFVHPDAMIVVNDKGQKCVDIEINGSKLSDQDKLNKRFGDYLVKRTLSTGGTKFNSLSDIEALRELRKMAVTANTQFDSWVKARPDIQARLNQKSTDASKLQFRPVDDEAELSIAGMNPELKLHGYQCSFVRQMSREFKGINGFDVGLGKTFTALAAVQYAHNMGVKNKTLFVVPNSTLSNWKKEAGKAYETMEDSLFIGLRTDKDGNEKVKSSEYAVDLSRIMENNHSKIFMTYEAFQMIRLKVESVEGYYDYLRRNDDSIQMTGDKKIDEKVKYFLTQITTVLNDKKSNVPNLEDLGIDSIVIDEAHLLKNATTATNTKEAKYLAMPKAAKRAVDAQAKLWVIRGKTPLNDGVLLLTATPITNSPLEVYSMLSLSVGQDKVNNLMMGAAGADSFLEIVCTREDEDDVSIDGIERVISVFKGLDNVTMLRNSIKNTCVIKTSKDVGDQIIVPEADTAIQDLQIGEDIVSMLMEYKGAFRYAIDSLNIAKTDRNKNRGDGAAFAKVSAKFDLTVELMAHPFNLLKNMELLVMDKDLDDRATFFTFPKEQLKLAKLVIEKFNGKEIKSVRPRMNPYTRNGAITDNILKTDEATGTIKEWIELNIESYLIDADTRIVIDTMETLEITAFEDLADAAGLTLNCTIPPKIAALLDNVSKEIMNPRGMIKDGDTVKKSSVVKQIIFCDILATHNKIRRLLAQKCGIPASKIATVTGKTNNEADDILEVQNGFNADGDDNKYQIILANKKAEVGINLQIGTQAIHHLTIGWTPDSLQQRNGRGQRQGNRTEKVNIFFYDADGTFDKQKRSMVERKGDWIGSLMSDQSTNKIDVQGGMSREQMEALMESVGDKDAMERYQENLQAKEAEARAKSTRERQLINLNTIAKQAEWLEANPTAVAYVQAAVNELSNLMLVRDKIKKREAKTETAKIKNASALAELEDSIDTLKNKIASSCEFFKVNYKGDVDEKYPNGVSAENLVREIKNWASNKPKTVLDKLKSLHTGIRYDIISGSAIDLQWQDNKTMAEGMIESSVKAFETQAADKGTFPASIARAIANGTGTILAGVPVIAGAFVLDADDIVEKPRPSFNIVQEVSRGYADVMYLFNFQKGGMASSNSYRLNVANITNLKLILPDDSGYTDMCKRAAKLEDTQAYATEKGVKLYSDYSSEVSGYRTKTQRFVFKSKEYTLPPPYFSIILNDEMAATPLLKKIAKEQSKVVKVIEEYKGHDVLVSVEKSLAVETSGVSYVSFIQLKALVPALMRYAKDHGLTLGMDDINVDPNDDIRAKSYSFFDDVIGRYFNNSPVIPALEEAVKSVDKVAEIKPFVYNYLIKELSFLSSELADKMVNNGNYVYHITNKASNELVNSKIDKLTPVFEKIILDAGYPSSHHQMIIYAIKVILTNSYMSNPSRESSIADKLGHNLNAADQIMKAAANAGVLPE